MCRPWVWTWCQHTAFRANTLVSALVCRKLMPGRFADRLTISRRGFRGGCLAPDGAGSTICSVTAEEREQRILQYLAQFTQLDANHIFELCFYGGTRTSLDRVMPRLKSRDFVRVVDRRTVGVDHGGSGPYVYQLGKEGFSLFFTGRYEPKLTIRPHLLAISDTFIQIKRLEHEGAIKVVSYSTEPDSWHKVRTDLYAETLQTHIGARGWAFEVEVCSKSPRLIKAKLEAYTKAYNETEGDGFPKVVFACAYERWKQDVDRIIDQANNIDKRLFTVTTIEAIPSLFSYAQV